MKEFLRLALRPSTVKRALKYAVIVGIIINAPVAADRNRERSAPEIALGRDGGDAAFADFSILVSFSHRF